MNKENRETNLYSRRRFLGKASLGLVAGLAFVAGAGRWLGFWRNNTSDNPSFPQDSIFRPREDPRRRD